MLSKRIARDWGESGPKESSAGSDVFPTLNSEKSEPHRWVCLRLPVSGTQVFQLYSARKQLPAPPASFRGGSFGEVGTPTIVSQNKREAGLGGGSPAHPPLRDSLAFLQVSLLRQGVNHRADAWSGKFSRCRSHKGPCVLLVRKSHAMERVWDSRPGVGHVLQSAGPSLSRERRGRRGVGARKPSAWTVKKSRIVPKAEAAEPPDGLLDRVQCQTVPARCAGEGGTHESQGKAAPNRPAPHRGASVVRLPHHELGGTDSKANVQFLLLPSVTDPDSVGPRQLSCLGIYIYSFFIPSPIFGSEFSRLNLTESKLFSWK